MAGDALTATALEQGLRALFAGERPALVLFDLDGTLVDSVPELAVAVDAMLAGSGLAPAGEHKVRDWVGNGARTLVQRALADAFGSAVSEVMLEQALARFKTEYAQVNGTRVELYPGVREWLAVWQQQGIPMAVVTNKPKAFADPLLQSLGVAGCFVDVVGGECLPERKPHPMPFLHAAEKSGVAAQRTLVVGDSRNDVLAARAAQMPVICRRGGYNHGEPIENANPDIVFDCYTQWLD